MEDLERLKELSIRRIKGPTILLGSGTYFDFEDPENSPITITDIAYALAFEARFAGQCVSRITKRRVLYSVAEHCVRESYAAEEIGRPDLALPALMHEVGEAVCGDVTGPLKLLCPDFKAVEKRCERAILARFGVEIRDPDTLKLLDLRMLATERRDLLPWTGEEWDFTKGAPPFDWTIEPRPSEDVALSFIQRFGELITPLYLQRVAGLKRPSDDVVGEILGPIEGDPS